MLRPMALFFSFWTRTVKRTPITFYMTASFNKYLRIYYGRVKEFTNMLDTLVDFDSTGFLR